MAVCSGRLMAPDVRSSRIRKSTNCTAGMARLPTRVGIEINSACPVVVAYHDSSDGVAVPNTKGIPSDWARAWATFLA